METGREGFPGEPAGFGQVILRGASNQGGVLVQHGVQRIGMDVSARILLQTDLLEPAAREHIFRMKR